jgi:phosphate transport system permease protein
MFSSTPATPDAFAPGALFEPRPGDIARAPSRGQRFGDAAFRKACHVFALLTMALVAIIVVRIEIAAAPAMRELGPGFLAGRVWDPNAGQFGILGEIWGTLYTSALALALGTLCGVAAAVFLSEGILSGTIDTGLRRLGLESHAMTRRLPEQVERLLKELIGLLAAIPSVVYGLWGIFVVIPFIRPYCDWLNHTMGWLPFFSTSLSGPGVLPAVIVLGIMILPTITAISRDALVAVPSRLRMAAYGLGATRWESILAVILPAAARGIVGGVVLAFGRALGETMALAMLAGNSNQISVSLFSPANTLAALLANNFPEAGPREVSILMYAALVLLAITLAVNILGAAILQRASIAHQE